MSRTYRRMKTERAPRRELRKNKQTWKEERNRYSEFQPSNLDTGDLV